MNVVGKRVPPKAGLALLAKANMSLFRLLIFVRATEVAGTRLDEVSAADQTDHLFSPTCDCDCPIAVSKGFFASAYYRAAIAEFHQYIELGGRDSARKAQFDGIEPALSAAEENPGE
ncbi:hypothetical protein [Bradyrhizobium ottawaense]|uniref:hypothetical protein n=1 Tax=Bradyrhizobium ottawaense TaxID=931866 RepID=UPI00117877B1|nr:hypothetical protein [Bradyrhizobium ottawaense]